MIDRLPLDVVSLITCYLDQYDTLNLARSNKYLHQIVIPKLYHSITVDSSKAQFQLTTSETATTIKYLHSFKLFVKGLDKNPHYGRLIKHFAFKNEIPDMPESMLLEHLEKLFPTLANLRTLNWFIVDTYLSFHLLAFLPLANLSNISGNFKNFETVKNTIQSPLLNLKTLHISGFNTVANLSTIDMLKFPNLLKLTVLKNSCGKADCLSDLIEIDPNEENYLSKLLLNLQQLNLSSLTLKDITIYNSNSSDLIKAVNLSSLEELSLINCNEILFDDSSVIRRTAPSQLFLDSLAPYLVNLETLRLDLLNELADNSSIIRCLDFLYLKKLDLLITSKNGESLNEDMSVIIERLKKHPIFELKLNFRLPNTSYKNVTISTGTLAKLSTLSHLKALTAPIEHSSINRLLSILPTLNELSSLHLILKDQKLSSNSLIDQNYFNFAVPGLQFLQSNSYTQFLNYCKKLKFYNQGLQYLIFENTEKFIFKCRDSIELIEG